MLKKIKKNLIKSIPLIIIIALIISLGLYLFLPDKNETYDTFIRNVEEDNVTSIEMASNKSYVDVILKDEEEITVKIPDSNEFIEYITPKLVEQDIEFKIAEESKLGNLVAGIFSLLSVAVSTVLIFVLLKYMRGTVSFRKSNSKVVFSGNCNVKFKDVAGLEEEKQEFEQIIKHYRHPRKYKDVKIPRGVLLTGLPGNGKTLLAKAVAGEAGVPFFSISGSDFVEMYVGVGASRVRDLFKQARANAPCVVFIDEIDAVGKKRSPQQGGSNSELDQTLNQLLTELDGFSRDKHTKQNNIIVVAATNRSDILDPALIRAGRFDKEIVVNPPKAKARRQILELYLNTKYLNRDIDIEYIVSVTGGCSASDLENIVEQAYIIAIENDDQFLENTHLIEAFLRTKYGLEKKSIELSERDRKITAVHEAGHSIIELNNEEKQVLEISIIPRGNAGGYTLSVPKNDDQYISNLQFKNNLVSLVAGREAEKLLLGYTTVGCSNDLKVAKNLAKSMIVDYAMDTENIVYLKRNDLNELSEEGEEKVQKLLTEAIEEAKKILSRDIDKLKEISLMLLSQNKIYYDDVINL